MPDSVESRSKTGSTFLHYRDRYGRFFEEWRSTIAWTAYSALWAERCDDASGVAL